MPLLLGIMFFRCNISVNNILYGVSTYVPHIKTANTIEKRVPFLLKLENI